jgi:hypothetical protein
MHRRCLQVKGKVLYFKGSSNETKRYLTTKVSQYPRTSSLSLYPIVALVAVSLGISSNLFSEVAMGARAPPRRMSK